MYLYLENRRVAENFVDTNGTKITAPSGFAQGKTVITSDSYTLSKAEICQIPIKSARKPISSKAGTKVKQTRHLDDDQSSQLSSHL